MYTILVNDDNSLTATSKQRIMQRSKLVDSIHFLVPQTYGSYDMSEFTCTLEVLLPTSHTYKTYTLTKSDTLVNDTYLEYLLPGDTDLTSEAGDIEVQLTFTMVVMDEVGTTTQYVRKTSDCEITIVPIKKWADLIPDSALSALDQRLIALDAKVQELTDAEETIISTTVDDLGFDSDGKLHATVKGTTIGTGVSVSVPSTTDTDGTDDGVIDLTEIYKTVSI